MISPSAKNRAMTMLSYGSSINEVAGELDLPLALVEEWSKTIPTKDLFRAETTLQAIELLNKTTDVSDRKDVIKTELQKVSLIIIDKINDAVTSDDILGAQLAKIAAEATSKLYSTIVGDSKGVDIPGVALNENTVSAFQSLLRD